jgi:hypothetical protein
MGSKKKKVLHYIFTLQPTIYTTMPGPNEMGRALEYAVLHELASTYAIVPKEGSSSLVSGESDFQSLPQVIQESYRLAGKAFIGLFSEKLPEPGSQLEVYRYPDQSGLAKKGKGSTVVDLMIYGKEKIPISIKNKNISEKHPRLSTLPEWLGVHDKPKKKILNDRRKAILDKYRNLLCDRPGNYTPYPITFRCLSNQENHQLYKEVLSDALDYLKGFEDDVDATQSLFFFLSGGVEPYYKLTWERTKWRVEQKKVTHFPSSFLAKLVSFNTIKIDFDNGNSFFLRLHIDSRDARKDVNKIDVTICS